MERSAYPSCHRTVDVSSSGRSHGHARVRRATGIDEPLIVTDREVEAAGLPDPIVDALESPRTYYAPTEPATADFDDLPTGSIDGIVALGGGSCIDTAKLAAVVLAHGGWPADYFGVARVPGPWRALTLVHGSLERAVFDGRNRDARRAMSLGSHLAGMAFSVSGLGAIHALASRLGGLTDRPHGACLAASIRPGLYYTLPVRREQYAAIAGALGVGTEPLSLLEECDRLREAIGLPGSFTEFDLSEEDVDTIVENTLLQERRLATNLRQVTADLREVLVDLELAG